MTTPCAPPAIRFATDRPAATSSDVPGRAVYTQAGDRRTIHFPSPVAVIATPNPTLDPDLDPDRDRDQGHRAD
jgi:hypothetical protein